MKSSTFVISLLLSLALIFSITEIVLTSILLSRSKKPGFSEAIELIDKISVPLDDIQELVTGLSNFLKRNQNSSIISIAYLLFFNSLDFVFLFFVFLSAVTKLKVRSGVEISIIGIVLTLKIIVYTLLLVYRYIASKGLELSSAIIGYINSVVLLGTFCYKIISN